MFNERKKLYKQLERIRNKPLITYVTSIRPNMTTNMASDAITPIIEQIDSIHKDKTEVDFLIISNGGDPITSLRIISLLRERFKKVSVLVPYVAYSAATVLALGADEIVMHPYSNLGPVDPQLTVAHNNERGIQERLQFSSEDLRNYIEFLKTDVGIADQAHLVAAIQPLLKDVGALPIGSAKRGQQLSLSLSEKMLMLHTKDANKAKSIARALNSSYYHHGYAVGRHEAKKIGLPVAYPEESVESLLWEIWKDYSREMKCDELFNVINEIMSDPDARDRISKVPVVNLPANTPVEVAQKIIIQRAQQTSIESRSSIKKKVLVASVESVNKASAVYNNIDIVYWRNADMSLGANCTMSSAGWCEYQK